MLAKTQPVYAVGLLVTGRNIAIALQPQVQVSSAGLNNARQARLDSSAMASLFGQFRTSMMDGDLRSMATSPLEDYFIRTIEIAKSL